MRQSTHRGSLLLALTLPAALLAGCAASPALERADDANSSAQKRGAPQAESAFATPPSGANGEGVRAPKSEGAAESSSGYESAPRRSSGRSASADAAPAYPQANAQAPEDRAESRRSGAGAAKSAQGVQLREPESRPGLGTSWGETRTSHVSQVDFARQSPNNPSAVFQIYYNDSTGILAQTGERSLDSFEPNYTEARNRFVSVEIVDSNGTPLLGISRGDRTYVVGSDGDRYAIRIRNHDGQRVEVVATVDGLDVIDGTRAGFSKRGYIVDPYATLLIEGFRRSSSAIAAFRFGAVADSYAARTQSDRHVGVIGVAVFGERARAPEYSEDELRRRESADPFPGRYARPPQR